MSELKDFTRSQIVGGTMLISATLLGLLGMSVHGQARHQVQNESIRWPSPLAFWMIWAAGFLGLAGLVLFVCDLRFVRNDNPKKMTWREAWDDIYGSASGYAAATLVSMFLVGEKISLLTVIGVPLLYMSVLLLAAKFIRRPWRLEKR